MTLEEYKLKYPEFTISGGHCWIITEISKDVAKMLGSYPPLQSPVWDIDLENNTIRFGSIDLTDEQIQDAISLKNTLVSQYQESNKQYEMEEDEKERKEEIAKLESIIEWRLQKIAKLEEEIDIHKHRIKCEENDLKKLITKEQQ